MHALYWFAPEMNLKMIKYVECFPLQSNMYNEYKLN